MSMTAGEYATIRNHEVISKPYAQLTRKILESIHAWYSDDPNVPLYALDIPHDPTRERWIYYTTDGGIYHHVEKPYDPLRVERVLIENILNTHPFPTLHHQWSKT